ncbi:MAG TPA: hypothetical protein VFM64_03555, partial [Candidatus Nitrosotenuis sp.]|nr:hypothetical protein [Candidatus Nitrosotenuis sp.]
MASLTKLAEKLKQQKVEASKARRRTEKELQEAKSLARRSTSGLHSVQKKLEDKREKLGEIKAEFTHILARKDSLERLIKLANERLGREMDAKEQAQIDIENADSDDAKQAAEERLAQITEKIQELKSEIKQRESAEQKLASVIDEERKEKTKTTQQIQKQVHTKPTLLNLMKKGTSASEKLKRRVSIAEKKEAKIKKNLQQVNEKLRELEKKRREMAKKAAALKRAAKRRLALKRKQASRRKKQ